jgi:hypothetical protein
VRLGAGPKLDPMAPKMHLDGFSGLLVIHETVVVTMTVVTYVTYVTVATCKTVVTSMTNNVRGHGLDVAVAT